MILNLWGAELPQIHRQNNRRGPVEGDCRELLRGDLREMNAVPEHVVRPVAWDTVSSWSCIQAPHPLPYSTLLSHQHSLSPISSSRE